MKKNDVTRRSFLKGGMAGAKVLVTLPLLELMFNSQKAFAAEFTYPRFINFYVPNGTVEQQWFPSSGDKDNFSLMGTALEPFETAGLKGDISLYKGMTSAGDSGGGNGHMKAIAGFLTGKPIPNDRIATHSVSLDQKLADFHQNTQPTRIHSVQLAGNPELDKPNNSNYNNQLKNALSFNSSGAILDNKANLQDVFNRLFTGGNNQEMVGNALDARKLSILDAVKDDANRVLLRAGQEDRIRLEQYFDGLRDVELEIQRANQGNAATCNGPAGFFPSTSDSDRNNAIGDHARAAAKLISSAYQCDVTRVFTYMAGGEAAGCAYDDIGIGAHIHNVLSHSINSSQSARDKYHNIDTFHSSLVANIMTELKNVPTPDGTLLNQTCVLYGAGMGNGDAHSLKNISLVVGGQFGNFQPGKFHTLNGRNHNELLMSLHKEFGLPGNSFGGNTNGVTAPIA